MEIYTVKNLSFVYPARSNPALSDISLSIGRGEFICLSGKSGCGKTTLLRLLKSALSPVGSVNGEILFMNKPLSETEQRTQAAKIGFVMQSPENQIVTDKVWHELAFGLESLGVPTAEIRTRVSEMASFFGIGAWFHKKVIELSGGQKQLLNLASVMVMQPDVLILDEPTSQLDPIAAGEFLRMLEKINRELGTTIILSAHRLEEAFPIAHRVVVMDNGKIIADGTPAQVGKILQTTNHDMVWALPTPMRVYGAVETRAEYPVTVRDGRVWLEQYAKENKVYPDRIPKPAKPDTRDVCIELKDVWFRYGKDLPDVVKGLHLQIKQGELFAILGGNGCGKTTTLSLISRLNTPYRGEVRIKGEKISQIANLYGDTLGVLPQNPQALFVKKTVYLDLLEMLSDRNMTKAEQDEEVKRIAALCRIDTLLETHPYDLSGGEQQRLALAKVLLKSPEILLLDEPTKGLDAHFKLIFAEILKELLASGVTIVMVSHDIEFCAAHATRCAMFFDGDITAIDTPRAFFAGNSFYTTGANRMARTVLPNAVLPADIILACGGQMPERKADTPVAIPKKPVQKAAPAQAENTQKLSPARIAAGCIFAILFVALCILEVSAATKFAFYAMQLITLSALAGSLFCFFPQREIGVQHPVKKQKLTKRTLTAALLILFAIPLTIYIGVYYLGDRKYYFISLLIILETLIPFFMVFEGRKPKARELVVISVLCAIAVAGRAAFFMLPQFKPVVAIVIIAGICFGGEAGFLVGAIVGFVSNFFFGQGPWAPWQMFAFGIIGFLAGVLFQKGLLRKTRAALAIFGFLATVIIYGGILNPASVLIWQPNPTKEMILSAYAMGLPFDLVHAASTAFFLWFLAEPMIEKLERIKIKYGLIER